MADDVLDLRTLGRATLARQLLLERADVGAVDAVARVGGLQAQEARPAFAGLWNRVADFDRQQLLGALSDRTVVRATAFRATLHLLTADDLVAFRASLDPVMARAMKVLGAKADALDLPAVLEAAEHLLAEAPARFDDLRPRLQAQFPDVDERALGYAVRTRLPLVMVPGDDRWGFAANAPVTPAAPFLGTSLAPGDRAPALAARYLAAFGPASAADFQTWSGLTGAKQLLESVDPPLRRFRDDQGHQLFDLDEAPRPDPDTPAPVRFLPEFDSLVLAHADRRRVVADEHRAGLVTKNLRVKAAVLLDGTVVGTWSTSRRKDVATLELTPLRRLTKKVVGSLEPEGRAVLAFLEEDAGRYEFAVRPAD